MTAGFISRSHRAIAPFELHRPTTIDDADGLVAQGAAVHAGGIDLVERMQSGHRVERVVDIGRIPALREISVDDGHVRIGAAVTHSEIESSPVIAEHRPDLAAAWATVGNVRIRRTGTVGGNLMSFDKNYDAAVILAAAGAQLTQVAAGTSTTTDVSGLQPDRLLTTIEVPVDGPELAIDRSLKPVVTVAVGAHLAIGCAYERVVVRPLGAGFDDLPPPIDDADASSTYRQRMIAVLGGRLLGATS